MITLFSEVAKLRKVQAQQDSSHATAFMVVSAEHTAMPGL